jgi:hypothetical protein
MTDNTSQGPVNQSGGQAPAAPNATGTTAHAPNDGGGQAGDTTQTTNGQGAQAPGQSQHAAQDTFFDPKDLPDELQGVYKQMQGAFTKKMQGLSAHKQKIEAYDAFMADPVAQIQQLAQQYGFTLSRNGQQIGQQQQGNSTQPNWEPQTWEEVFAKAEERAEQRLMAKLGPILSPLYQNVEKITSNHIEQQLETIDANWRLYEDDIKANMKEAPHLIKSAEGIKKLYRISVPEEVYHSRAVQDALKKMQNQTNLAHQGSKSQTQHSQPATKPASTFAEAIQQAKEQLAKQGR